MVLQRSTRIGQRGSRRQSGGGFIDVAMSLHTDSSFNALIYIPSVHDAEDPNFVLDDPEHYSIIADS